MRTLHVTYVLDRNSQQMAIIRDLPGLDAEFSLSAIRALLDALGRVEAEMDRRRIEDDNGRFDTSYDYCMGIIALDNVR